MQIKIDLYCEEKLCGNCQMRELSGLCSAFRNYMEIDRNKKPIRLHECIEAQV